MHEIYFKRCEILNHLNQLNKYIEQLKSRNYASKGYVQFANDLQKIIEIIINNNDKILDVHLTNFSDFLNIEILSIISYLEKSTPEYIPWSMLPELKIICEKLINSEEEIILKADNELNYTVQSPDIITWLINEVQAYTGELEDFKKTRFIRPRILTIPYLERTNVLLHSILFHEIGHYFEKNFSDDSNNKNIITNILLEAFNKQYKKGTDFDIDLFTLNESTNILVGAIREIYSDIFGVFYGGLPFLFALRHFSINKTQLHMPNKETDYYPPLKFRLRKIVEVIEKENIFTLFAKNAGNNNYYNSIKIELY